MDGDLSQEKMKNAQTDTGPPSGDVQSVDEGMGSSRVILESEVHFKKDLGWIGILAAGFNASQSWIVMGATLSISLLYGPMNVIWGVISVTPIYLCIGLTLAELVSAYPSTGGQYHWTFILAPPKYKSLLSYLCGFVSWFSWVTMTASSLGAISTLIYALVANSSPQFEPQNWHSFLFYEVMNILSLCINLFGKKIIGGLYSVAFFLSLSSFVAITVTVLAMQKNKPDSSVVWTAYTQDSGWPAGVQFLIALGSPAISFCPLDGVVHLVEEVRDAPKVVPRAVLSALVISFITGVAFTLGMLYGITDYTPILETTTSPIYEVWRQATNTTAAPTAFSILILVLLPVGSFATYQVASMMTLSFGRDYGLPFGRYLSRVNHDLNAPTWSLMLNFVVIFIIGLLYLGSPLAFNSTVGAAVTLQQITIAFPSALLIYHRRSEFALPPSRIFRLPDWLGWIANVVSLLFTFITSTFLFFPVSVNPDSSTMNYAIAVTAGVILLGLVNWFAFARKHYTGPSEVNFHY